MQPHRFCPYCKAPSGAPPSPAAIAMPACRTAAASCTGTTRCRCGAVVEYEDKSLLARNAVWPEGMFARWSPASWSSDETPELGVAREFKEETNLDTEIRVRLIGVYEFMRKNELIIAYPVKATGRIELLEELAEYKLVAPEKVRIWERRHRLCRGRFPGAARAARALLRPRASGEDIPDLRRPTDFSLVAASLQYGIDQK